MKKKLFKTKATKTHMIINRGKVIQKFAIEGAVLGDLGAEPPALENFAFCLKILPFFFKNDLILGLY